MTGLAASVLFLLTLANRAIGNSMLYPPAVFTAAWTGYLLCLSLLGTRFFPLSVETLGVYFVGALALSLGGLLVSLFRESAGKGGRAPFSRPDRTISRLLDIGFWACVLAFPARLMRLRELGDVFGTIDILSPDFWLSVRRASLVEADENRLVGLALTDNFILLAFFLALAALAEDVARKRLKPRTVGLILVAIVYNVMTAGRASAVIFFLGLAGIAWMAARRLPWKVAGFSMAGLALIFALGSIFMKKGGDVAASTEENVSGIWGSLEFYSLGGVVAFDHTVRIPNDITPVWTVTRSFIQVANKLGAHVDLPSLHADYAPVSSSERTNVYTMYFAYFPHFGWGGVVILPFVLGVALTRLFWSTWAGDPRARLLYACAIGSLALSGYNENFYMNLNFFVKAGLFSLALYGLPRIGRAVPAAGTGKKLLKDDHRITVP